ncbi:ORF6N domain-containing protein [Clostridium akagii]|uniref:ORF6N domain-containing protein n=1 Tax=Clostridium akagii TaxID=91623 RepID=UPI0006903FC0|nr:ORF6N domain-containing protein [Clostridium akagii]
MSNLIKINNQDLEAKEFKGQRVVTFKDIDLLHERVKGTASKRFIDNEKHFEKGSDYFELTGDELKEIKRLSNFGIGLKLSKFTLITESGYLMLVKSFTDDLAWKVQRQLVNSYFKVKENINSNPDITDQIKIITHNSYRNYININ